MCCGSHSLTGLVLSCAPHILEETWGERARTQRRSKEACEIGKPLTNNVTPRAPLSSATLPKL